MDGDWPADEGKPYVDERREAAMASWLVAKEGNDGGRKGRRTGGTHDASSASPRPAWEPRSPGPFLPGSGDEQ